VAIYLWKSNIVHFSSLKLRISVGGLYKRGNNSRCSGTYWALWSVSRSLNMNCLTVFCGTETGLSSSVAWLGYFLHNQKRFAV
jgi:hypothetical protein